MFNLYTIETKNESRIASHSLQETVSILYHDLFDFPMSFADLVRWTPSKSVNKYAQEGLSIISKCGFSYLEGREGIIFKRILRKRISDKKVAIAKKAAHIISFVATVKMVAVTGSLAMENASDESDIDLMIVTKGGSLWTTRILIYSLMGLFGLKTRKPNDKNQKDKLCLNMWLDERNLTWHDRNIYSAHEIAQIVPILNKDKTYEKFLVKNKWILSYWPSAVKIQKLKIKYQNDKSKFKNILHFALQFCTFIFDICISLLEKVSFWVQYEYMRGKITREIITPTRALFHPQDWGKVVLGRLSS